LLDAQLVNPTRGAQTDFNGVGLEVAPIGAC
jgi:hypothetical protein